MQQGLEPERLVFLVYVQDVLGPTLTAGDLVIMDNLSAHKVSDVREAIEATGASLLYLPPHSPNLNHAPTAAIMAGMPKSVMTRRML